MSSTRQPSSNGQQSEPIGRLTPAELSHVTERLAAHVAAGHAPDGLQVPGTIDLSERKDVPPLPRGLKCFELLLGNSNVERLPEGLEVGCRLDLSNCTGLVELPRDLKAPTLILAGCTSLKELPPGLKVDFLDLTGCTALERLPDDLVLEVGGLICRGCTRLETLPALPGRIAWLDLGGCSRVTSLPEGLDVASWIDVGGSGLAPPNIDGGMSRMPPDAGTPVAGEPAGTAYGLPGWLEGVQIRWRGVEVNERVAFQPETLTVDEILNEGNAELRRVMLERYGFDRFMADASAEVLDQDEDAGGVRRLLKVELPGDEDLLCVAVSCPSTGRRYMIRVPPNMTSCHQAIAWTAGFDNPDDYRPEAET